MTEWTTVKGVLRVPRRLHLSIPKVLRDHLLDVSVVTFTQKIDVDVDVIDIEFKFNGSGAQAAKEMGSLLSALKGCEVEMYATTPWQLCAPEKT